MKEITKISDKIRKVLIVDDSELLHRMYDLIFFRCKNNGLKILHAYDGREALSKLSEHPDTNLIILDIHMPVMNGLQFLRHCNKEGIHQKIPVIITGTQGKEEDTMEGIKAGAKAYLVKPFETENFYKVINKVFYEEPVGFQKTLEVSRA